MIAQITPRASADNARPVGFIRPQPMQAETFQAWRVTALNEWGHENSRSIDVSGATTLQEAMNAAANAYLAHKDRVSILHTKGGKQFQHVYAVKQRSQTYYQRDPVTGLMHAVRPFYLDHIFAQRVDAFAPTEPVDVMANPVGVRA